MVRPSCFLRAFVATGSGALALGLALGLVLAPAPPATADPGPPTHRVEAHRDVDAAAPVREKVRHARALPRDTSPLRVTISGLSPSYLPLTGDIVVRGQVTNRTGETWTTIKLYAFMGDDLPAMRTPAALEAAMVVPFDAYVGSRVTRAGEPGKIASLEPGQRSSFIVRVPVSAFDVPQGGVYWFGVHAIGQSGTQPRDDLADGRARTFLPYVPSRVTTPVKAALVLPLTRSLRYRDDGALDSDLKWVRSLSPGGRLRDLLTFVAAAGDNPVTWVVDPALIDGIGRLASGNPPRTITPAPDPGPSDTPSPDDTAGDTADDVPDETSPPDSASARAATAWLEALPAALSGNEVLTLPYGNIDVPAAIKHDPTLYEVARAERSGVLDALEVPTAPVLAAPVGYFDTASIRSAGDDTQLLVSDRMFAQQGASVTDFEGHQIVVASSGAPSGSPGPGPSITAVGLRQRILAEAAVRALRADQQPLTVVLPTEWGLTSSAEFFAGLDVDWLDLSTLSELRSASVPSLVTEEDLVYPPVQRRRELDAATFDSATSLLEGGDTLQNVLGENSSIAGVVTKEALSAVSYAARGANEVSTRGSADSSRAWIDERLGQVTITASAGVTLSSASGTFLVTLSNGLEEPVTVSVLAQSDADLTITAPEPVLLAPGSRTNVLLEVSTTSNRVHNVTLSVTDAQGVPLGDTDELPIRSAQVSDVIWLIMGSGVGLLFLAIAIRLVRRVRTARRSARLESA